MISGILCAAGLHGGLAFLRERIALPRGGMLLLPEHCRLCRQCCKLRARDPPRIRLSMMCCTKRDKILVIKPFIKIRHEWDYVMDTKVVHSDPALGKTQAAAVQIPHAYLSGFCRPRRRTAESIHISADFFAHIFLRRRFLRAGLAGCMCAAAISTCLSHKI